MENLELEAAITTSDKRAMLEASEWFDNHWDTSVDIDKTSLDQVRPLWRLRTRSAETVLSLLVASPHSIGGMPIRLIVFEAIRKREYIDAWTKVQNEYPEEEIRKNGWDGENHPFYIDYGARWNIGPGDYFVDYWAEASGVRSKSFSYKNEGSVWRFKGIKWIEIDGKKTKVILCDRVREVHLLKFSDRDRKNLGMCVRKYLERNKIGKRNILMNVPLSGLPTTYPTIYRSLKRQLAPSVA